MRYDHFSMLPERAFQPRGPYGMTLEGGGGGIIGDIFGGIGDAIEGAVDAVGDVVSGTVDFVQDVGRDIDDFVNEEIPGGWVTVAAVGTGMYFGGAETAALSGTAEAATAAELAAAGSSAGAGTAAGLGAADAITAAEWFGGAGAATSPGAIFGSAAPPAGLIGGGSQLASVGETIAPTLGPGVEVIPIAPSGPVTVTPIGPPNAFETAVSTGLGQTPAIGGAGSVGTGGFGTALPPAAQVAGGLESAGFAAGTAANLAGTTAAGVGATGLLGGATATPIIAGAGLSAADAIRAAQIANALTEKPQQQTATQPIGAQPTQAMGIDYSGLFGLLAQRAKGTGLLGTQFQPQPVNLLSLLG